MCVGHLFLPVCIEINKRDLKILIHIWKFVNNEPVSCLRIDVDVDVNFEMIVGSWSFWLSCKITSAEGQPPNTM